MDTPSSSPVDHPAAEPEPEPWLLLCVLVTNQLPQKWTTPTDDHSLSRKIRVVYGVFETPFRKMDRTPRRDM